MIAALEHLIPQSLSDLPATAEGEVMQEINNEIANEEVDAARLRHSARDTEKGQTHG